MTNQMIFDELTTVTESLEILKAVFAKITEFCEKCGITSFSGEVFEKLEEGGHCATAGLGNNCYAYFYIDGTSDGSEMRRESWADAVAYLLSEIGLKVGGAESRKIENVKLQKAIAALE